MPRRSRSAMMVMPQALSDKNLTATYYATLEMECTSSKRHRRVFHHNEVPSDGPPCCEVDNCGMPMLPIRAEARFEVNSVKLKAKGTILEVSHYSETVTKTPRRKSKRTRK